MIRPTAADIGRRVIYCPRPDAKPEEGVITSLSKAWVFVRYGGDPHAKATAPGDLEWMAPRILRAVAETP